MSVGGTPKRVQLEVSFHQSSTDDGEDSSDDLSSEEPEPEGFCRQVTETQWPSYQFHSMDSLDSIDMGVLSMDSLPSMDSPHSPMPVLDDQSLTQWPAMQPAVMISPLQCQLAQAALSIVAGYGNDEQPRQQPWSMEPEKTKKKNNRRKGRSLVGRAHQELKQQQQLQQQLEQQEQLPIPPPPPVPVVEAASTPPAPAEVAAATPPPQRPAEDCSKQLVAKFCYSCGGATEQTHKFCRFCGAAVFKSS